MNTELRGTKAHLGEEGHVQRVGLRITCVRKVMREWGVIYLQKGLRGGLTPGRSLRGLWMGTRRAIGRNEATTG